MPRKLTSVGGTLAPHKSVSRAEFSARHVGSISSRLRNVTETLIGGVPVLLGARSRQPLKKRSGGDQRVGHGHP